MKGDTEEAMIVRKPWVCLSCDKQEKEKEHQKKESKMKKGEPFKGIFVSLFRFWYSEEQLKDTKSSPSIIKILSV